MSPPQILISPKTPTPSNVSGSPAQFPSSTIPDSPKTPTSKNDTHKIAQLIATICILAISPFRIRSYKHKTTYYDVKADSNLEFEWVEEKINEQIEALSQFQTRLKKEIAFLDTERNWMAAYRKYIIWKHSAHDGKSFIAFLKPGSLWDCIFVEIIWKQKKGKVKAKFRWKKYIQDDWVFNGHIFPPRAKVEIGIRVAKNARPSLTYSSGNCEVAFHDGDCLELIHLANPKDYASSRPNHNKFASTSEENIFKNANYDASENEVLSEDISGTFHVYYMIVNRDNAFSYDLLDIQEYPAETRSTNFVALRPTTRRFETCYIWVVFQSKDHSVVRMSRVSPLYRVRRSHPPPRKGKKLIFGDLF